MTSVADDEHINHDPPSYRQSGALLVACEDEGVTTTWHASVDFAQSAAEHGWEDYNHDVNTYVWWHIIDLATGYVVLSEMPETGRSG